jgi:hypothetical protein
MEAGKWCIARRRYDPLLYRAADVVTASPFPTEVPKLEEI